MVQFFFRSTVLALVMLWGGAVLFSPAVGDKKVDRKLVAVVNGQPISRNDFEREVSIYKQRIATQRMGAASKKEADLRMEVLNDLVNRELIYQESRKRGFEVSTEEVDMVINEMKQRYPDSKAFQSVLARMQLTEEHLRAQIRRQSVIRNYVNREIGDKIEISDATSKSFYQDNPRFFQQPEQVHARHILIKIEAGANEKTKGEARQKIASIKKRAESGEDFGEIAKIESQGPSAIKGGDLGFFSKGRMVPAFEKAAFGMKVNEISDLVETNFGYHLIQVLDRRESRTLAYLEVKERITINLRNEQIKRQVDSHIAALRKTAKIETFLQ